MLSFGGRRRVNPNLYPSVSAFPWRIPLGDKESALSRRQHGFESRIRYYDLHTTSRPRSRLVALGLRRRAIHSGQYTLAAYRY